MRRTFLTRRPILPLTEAAAVAALIVLGACSEEPTAPTTPEPGTPPVVSAPELATVSVGTWTEKAPLPTPRYDMAAGVITNSSGRTILYTLGGVGFFPDRTYTTVEAYDPNSNTWSSKADMPYKASSFNGTGVISGILYISGGLACDVCGTTDQLAAYNPVTDTWALKASLPISSQAGITGVIDGKLYVLTGVMSAGEEFNNIYTRRLYRYNPASDTWIKLTSAPNRHVGGAGGVINGKFYVAGGGNGTGATLALDVYDPVTDAWTTKAPMPMGNSGPGVVLNKRLYVIGRGGSSIIAYDPATNAWSGKASLPISVTDLAAGKVKNSAGQWQIVVAAGGGGIAEFGEQGVTFAYTPAAPSAYFGSTCGTGLSCSFSDRSKNGDGTIVTWRWTFGDGTGSTARNPSHTYGAAGTYKVILKVTDNLGYTGSIFHSVTVP